MIACLIAIGVLAFLLLGVGITCIFLATHIGRYPE
jgi:hypothetical protein